MDKQTHEIGKHGYRSIIIYYYYYIGYDMCLVGTLSNTPIKSQFITHWVYAVKVC